MQPFRFMAFVYFLALFFTAQVQAGVNEWTTHGPDGGWITSLVVSKATPATMYAGTQGGGVFKSTDGGESWTASSNGLIDENSGFLGEVGSLAVNPTNPQIVYAVISGAGLVKSIDGGANWSQVTNNGVTIGGSVVVFDPLTPTTVYIVGGQNILKSTDGGESWQTFTVSSSDLRPLMTLVIDPKTPTILYTGGVGLGFQCGGFFKSTDGGQHWQDLSGGLGCPFIRALAIDPITPTTLYAPGTTLLKSTDGGISWSQASTGLPDSTIRALLVDPMTPSTLYVGLSGGGVYKSMNGGVSWSAVNTDLLDKTVQVLAMNPANPGTLYVGTSRGGVYQSANGGGDWNAKNHGLVASLTRALVTDPTAPSTLYAATNIGVFKTTDSGMNWVPMNTDLATPEVPFQFIFSLAIDPHTPSTLYAGAALGIFKSTNGGGQWIAKKNGLPEIGSDPSPLVVQAIVIDPQTPTTIYAALANGGGDGGIFKSINGGEDWNRVDIGLTERGEEDRFPLVFSLVIDPLTPTTLYLGVFGSGVLKSTDGGIHWNITGEVDPETGLTNLAQGGGSLALAIDPVAPTTLYAGGGEKQVFKSTDGGTSWNPTGNGLPPFAPVYALAIDPVTPTILYAGTSGYGVFKSMDGGASWSEMNKSLSNGSVFALAVNPLAPTTIYAGTGGAGVAEFEAVGPQTPGIIGYFETPEAGFVSGITVIRGWAFSTKPGSQIRSVKVFLSDESFDAPCCSERSDVQAAFPQFPAENTLKSGWGITFNWGGRQGVPNFAQRQIRVEVQNTEGEHFFSDVRSVTLMKPGDFEFLNRFDLSAATTSIADNDLVVDGVVVRDKATQQQRRINSRFRWAVSSQAFGMVGTAMVEDVASWRSSFSTWLASLPSWLATPIAIAQPLREVPLFFEDPAEGQIVSGIRVIRGWAFPDDIRVSRVAVGLAVDGEFVGDIPCCSARQDVAAAFPEHDNALSSGWGILYNYGRLSTGPHQVTVSASAYAGYGSEARHNVVVVKPGGSEFLDQFDLSSATARIEGEEIILNGVMVRDKASQQTKTIEVRLRWSQSSQGLEVVAAT